MTHWQIARAMPNESEELLALAWEEYDRDLRRQSPPKPRYRTQELLTAIYEYENKQRTDTPATGQAWTPLKVPDEIPCAGPGCFPD